MEHVQKQAENENPVAIYEIESKKKFRLFCFRNINIRKNLVAGVLVTRLAEPDFPFGLSDNEYEKWTARLNAGIAAAAELESRNSIVVERLSNSASRERDPTTKFGMQFLAESLKLRLASLTRYPNPND